MPDPRQGEIWRVDLGMTAKVRPCLVLTNPPDVNDLMLYTIVPHTTALRRIRWECQFRKTFCSLELFTSSKSNQLAEHVLPKNSANSPNKSSLKLRLGFANYLAGQISRSRKIMKPASRTVKWIPLPDRVLESDDRSQAAMYV